MNRLLASAAIVVAAGSAVYAASAAGLGPVSSGLVSAGEQAIVPCDTGGITVSYTTVGGNVTAATVGDIDDPDCDGGEVSLTLVDTGDASIASGGPVTIPADGDSSPSSALVTLGPQPTAELVAGYRIVIAGP